MKAWSSPYILTHNWKLFFLIVWCSVYIIGCHHISYHILSTKGLHTHITAAMHTFGAHLSFLVMEHQKTGYHYGWYPYLWCSTFISTYLCIICGLLPEIKVWQCWRWWQQMTYMNNHDECSVLTIYSLYIPTHTEHQTTTSSFILLIFYCKQLVTVL